MSHKQKWLSDFHQKNSEACLKDFKESKKKPLSIDDVIAQSKRQGRTLKKIGE